MIPGRLALIWVNLSCRVIPNFHKTKRIFSIHLGRTYKDKKGYPRWKDTGRLVHRDVAKKMIGGPIGKGRVVHHKDGNKSNFRKSNLVVMNRSAHSTLHAKKRRRKK